MRCGPRSGHPFLTSTFLLCGGPMHRDTRNEHQEPVSNLQEAPVHRAQGCCKVLDRPGPRRAPWAHCAWWGGAVLPGRGLLSKALHARATGGRPEKVKRGEVWRSDAAAGDGRGVGTHGLWQGSTGEHADGRGDTGKNLPDKPALPQTARTRARQGCLHNGQKGTAFSCE